MKNNKTLLIALFCAISVFSQNVWNETWDTLWYNRTATQFTITTAEQLAGLAHLTNRANNPINFEGITIILGADIDLGDKNWTPIGNGMANGRTRNVFRGTFDGNGHSISNLSILFTSVGIPYVLEYTGLFGVVTGQIKNLIVNVTKIRGYGHSTNDHPKTYFVGGLVGLMAGTIENCGVNIKDTITAWLQGPAGTAFVGGLAGEMNEGTINNSFANVRNLGGSTRSGTSIVQGGATGRGGLVGRVMNSAIIRNSYAIGTISGGVNSGGHSNAGGLVGRYHGISLNITNSYASVERTGNTEAAPWGIIGGNQFFAAAGFGGVNTFSVYFNSDMANNAVPYGGNINVAGITSENLKRQTTFVGWDFNNIWAIAPNINNGFPFLPFWGNWIETTAATCGTTGEETRTCLRHPNYKTTRTIAALGAFVGQLGNDHRSDL